MTATATPLQKARRSLLGLAQIETPPQARALYARYPQEAPAPELAIAGTHECQRQAAEVFAAVLRDFLYAADAPGRDIWGAAKRVRRWIAGTWRWLSRGDCDDFAWLCLLALRQVEGGRAFPRGCLRLAVCEVAIQGRLIGHQVLTIETTAGTLVLDPPWPGALCPYGCGIAA